MSVFKSKTLLLLVSIWLLSCGFANGGEYYVSKAGNDQTGDGRITNPWHSIAMGVSRLAAGDTLNIRQGTYQEADVRIRTSGSEGNPIIIKNFENEKVFLSGTKQIDNGWEQYNNNGQIVWRLNVWQDDISKWQKDAGSNLGVNSRGTKFWPRIVIQNAKGYVQGQFLKSDPESDLPVPPHQEEFLSDVDVPGEWYFEKTDGFLYVFPRDIYGAGYNANNYTFEIGVLGRAFQELNSDTFSYIIIEGLHFYGYTAISLVENDQVQSAGAISFSKWEKTEDSIRSHIEVRNCMFEKCYRPIVLVQIDDIKVTDCQFIECFDQGIALYAVESQDLSDARNHNATISGCSFTRMYDHYPTIAGGGNARSAAIKIMGTVNAVVENCEIDFAENMNGIWFDVASTDGVISDNIVSQAGKAGIFIENRSDNAQVTGNIVRDCRMGIKVGTVNEIQGETNAPKNTVIYSNYIVNCLDSIYLLAAIKPSVIYNSMVDSTRMNIYLSDSVYLWNNADDILLDSNIIGLLTPAMTKMESR
ncbi:MAG: right-handed parallel beta-helix repeat-containing protein [Proteobacteria bacterium]|nr:right-handed parallel beta-helix repeat-containing protein [Pseudomonadota bacterium]